MVSKLRPGLRHFAYSEIFDLRDWCDRLLHSGSGRTVRYTRDDLRTMVRRVVVPSSLTTSSVPNKAHRRFRRFQMVILTSISLTFILYVYYQRGCECQGLYQRLQTPLHSARYEGAAQKRLWDNGSAEARIEANGDGWVAIEQLVSTAEGRYSTISDNRRCQETVCIRAPRTTHKELRRTQEGTSSRRCKLPCALVARTPTAPFRPPRSGAQPSCR